MLEVERSMLRMSPYNLQVTFSEYLDSLNKAYPFGGKKGVCLQMYHDIFNILTDIKHDFFNAGDYFVFLSQLLFGCRISEVKGVTTLRNENKLSVYIPSLKGTKDRHLKYDMTLPIIKTYMTLDSLAPTIPSYNSYYRSLLRACPNLYPLYDRNHLAATHLPRHFFIQVLYYVLAIPREAVIDILSWHQGDTLDNYIDQHIFRNVYKGGECGTINNRSYKGLGSSSISGSCAARIGSTPRKVDKKKKKQIKSKE